MSGNDDRTRTLPVHHYASLFHDHPHGVFALDLTGTVVEVNPAAGRISGYHPADILGMSYVDLIHPRDTTQAVSAFDGARRRTPQEQEIVVRHRDGRYLDIAVTVFPWIVEDEVHGVYGILEDVTERNLMIRDLEVTRRLAVAASEAKSDFVARMSHEVRTPLTSILACVELMKDAQDVKDRRRLIDIVQRSGHRLLSLVDSVLDFGAAGTSHAQASEEFDLHVALGDVVVLAANLAGPKDVEVALVLDDDVPQRVRDHPTWTTQVLTNLLSNAVEHTERGRVELAVGTTRSATSGLCVIYRVSDTGAGIDPEDHEWIFEPFNTAVSASTATGPSRRGTGLGLSIVKQLATICGGTVAVDSRLGHGTVFTVVMPVTVVEERSHTA